MYELIVLGFLMRRPMHGYLIAKIINDMIGPFAKVSHGRLYPLLTKLEEEGLIAVADESLEGHCADRRQRTFTITATGRERFHQLMMDTTANPGEYQKLFWQKVPFLDALQHGERLHLLDHYLTYCQTHVFHIQSEMEQLVRDAARRPIMSADQLEATLHVMRHLMSQWDLDLEHAREWREREVSRTQGSASTERGTEVAW